MKFESQITTEFVIVESTIFIMEPFTLLNSSGRGHSTQGKGYSSEVGVGAGHGAVGGYGEYYSGHWMDLH